MVKSPSEDAAANAFRSLHKLVTDTSEAAPALLDSLLAFAELLTLVDAAGPANADMQKLYDLQGRTSALPNDITMLVFAAMAGQLTLTPDTAQLDTAQAAPAEAPSIDLPPSTPVDQVTAIDPESANTPAGATESAAEDQDPPPVPALTPTDVPTAPPAATKPAPRPTEPRQPASTAPTPTSAVHTAAQTVAEAYVEPVLTELITQRRFGLAATIIDNAEHPSTLGYALRLAALADTARGETGPTAARLRTLLTEAVGDELADQSTTRLLAVPALIRAALVTGDPTTGALLNELAPRLEPHLATVAAEVGRRALQGVLLGGPLRTVMADVTGLETRLSQARANAEERLRPRTLRFKRATDIAHRWLAPEGLIGDLLTAAATDDRKRAGAVTVEVLRLTDRVALGKELDQLDRHYKGNSGRPIEGAGRQDLLALADDALAQVSAWLEAVADAKAINGDTAAWANVELSGMRASVHAERDAVLTALDETARPDTLSAAVAAAARHSLALSFALLDGDASLPGAEPLPDVVLTAELLKVPGARVDATSGRVTVPQETTLAALLHSATMDWAAAFTAKLDTEDYPSANYVLTQLLTGALPGADTLAPDAAQELSAATAATRSDLIAEHNQLLGQLRRARLQNEISEEQDGELTGMLDDADPSEHRTPPRNDLDEVRTALATAARRLPRYREEAAARLRQRLSVLAEKPGREPLDIPHVERLISDGQLSTAEELIYFLEIGEQVPKPAAREDLTTFFPAVPDALPAGITPDVIAAVRTGATLDSCAALDFAGLSPDVRTTTADALDRWRLVGSTPPEGRGRLDERATSCPRCAWPVSSSAPSTLAKRLDLPRDRERRFVELTDVTYNGKAMVPQFGSQPRRPAARHAVLGTTRGREAHELGRPGHLRRRHPHRALRNNDRRSPPPARRAGHPHRRRRHRARRRSTGLPRRPW